MLLAAFPSGAETLRIAVFDAELSARGPGLMLRDLRRKTPASLSVARTIADARPDVILVLGVDQDHDLLGAHALRDLVAELGHPMPEAFARPTNRGLASGIDLNGDGRAHGPQDAQGYGRFPGHGGMVLFSRWPVLQQATQDFTSLRWRDMPGAKLPVVAGTPFPSDEAQQAQRLSSNGHWIATIVTPDGPLQVMAFDATPPVFDGPEDRNGLRNADEIRLWLRVLDGQLGQLKDAPLAIVGNANQDPRAGEGRKDALHALLSHPRLQDPVPQDRRGTVHTAEWPEPGPGRLRVDYVLPSNDLRISGAGILRPEGADASRHSLVWVDVEM